MGRTEQESPVGRARPLVEMFLEKAGSALVKIEDVELLQGDNGDVGLSAETLNELSLATGSEGTIWMRGVAKPEEQRHQLSFVDGRVVIDTDAAELSIDGEFVKLQPKQYEVLEFLCSSPRKVISSRTIVNKVWDGFTVDETPRVYIYTLRKHLGELGWIIRTKRGLGYMLDDRQETRTDIEQTL